MVKDPGKEASLGTLRSLGSPKPVEVKANHEGYPVAVRLGKHWLNGHVLDHWRIDDEWWRQHQVSRAYSSFLSEDGRSLTLFQDLLTGSWFSQATR